MRDDVCQEIVSFKIHEVFGIWQFFQSKFQNTNYSMLYVKLRPKSVSRRCGIVRRRRKVAWKTFKRLSNSGNGLLCFTCTCNRWPCFQTDLLLDPVYARRIWKPAEICLWHEKQKSHCIFDWYALTFKRHLKLEILLPNTCEKKLAWKTNFMRTLTWICCHA